MLAARGVSLGLGGRINLSELNHLPKDKMMLGKLNKMKSEQKKAKQRAQQARLVVRKHVDPKTLWTACANVIVGVAIIVIGLVMTVLGYFDSNEMLFHSSTFSADEHNNDEQPAAAVNNFGTNSWIKYALKSMQYVGPVFCGIGMFLMIIACVITLESRDRHAQIIQEESTELRRSRRQRINGLNGGQIGKKGPEIRENGLAIERRHTHSAGERNRSKDVPNNLQQNQEMTSLTVRDGARSANQLHAPTKFASTVNPPTIPLLYELSMAEDFSFENESSTDAMNDYTFPERMEHLEKKRIRAREQQEKCRELNKEHCGHQQKSMENQRIVDPDQIQNAASAEIQQQLFDDVQHQPPIPLIPSSPRRKSTSATVIQMVNKRTPRGTAPLAWMGSVVELSLSTGGGSPLSSTSAATTPKRRNQNKQ